MITKELFSPASVVVIGGSNDMSKPGGTVLRNIINGGYSGELHVLNPHEKTVQGIKAFNDPLSLPAAECAIFAIHPEETVKTAEILARNKTKAFIVLSAGFGETGPDGKKLEDKLTAIVNSVNGTLIGPNCTGVLFPGFAAAFAGPIPDLVPHGVDLAAASGAVAVFTLERAIPMGLRFSSVIAVGNSAQCGIEEIVRYWDESFDGSGSKVKMLYMEQIKRPDLLIKHCRSLIDKGCRIAAVKAGATEAGSRAAQSHTGALASPDIAVDALFRKCGITRCSGREELIYTAGVMTHRMPEGKNFAVITHAGGPGVMAADTLSRNGMNVPAISSAAADALRSRLFTGSSTTNPVDFIGTGTAEQLGMIMDFIDNECPEIDASMIIFGSPGLFDVTHVYDLLDAKMKSLVKPVFPVLPSTLIASEAIEHFRSLGRVFFPDEVLLAESLASVCSTNSPFHDEGCEHENRKLIRRLIERFPEGHLPPACVAELLDAAGIPGAREIQVQEIEELESAAVSTGFPLAMKVIGPVHKSDSGGVILNINTLEKVKSSFSELVKIKGATGVLLQEMAEGTELFIGGKREPLYGPVILCGAGGIYVEILKDFSAGIAPLGKEEAINMIRRLKSYEIIKGARGSNGVDEKKFAGIISKVSLLLTAAPEIREIDINPLIGSGETIISVDCRIFIEK